MHTEEQQKEIAAIDSRRSRLNAVAVGMAMAIILYLMGQPLWCKCGGLSPWSWDIWSSHNSQHAKGVGTESFSDSCHPGSRLGNSGELTDHH